MSNSVFGKCPRKKITVRVPLEYIEYLQKDAKEFNMTLTEATEMMLSVGMFYSRKEDEEQEKEAREQRKRDGYLKRSLRRRGYDV